MESGGLVRKYREALGLSQAELGRAVGVSQATIDKIESGRTTMSRFLPRIAARLGIPQRELDPFIGLQPRQAGHRETDADDAHEYADASREAAQQGGSPARQWPPHGESTHSMRVEDVLRPDQLPSIKPPIAASETELPVYIASAQEPGESGAGDTFPIDLIRRPPPLANVRGAYGLLVRDAAMEPEFWPGDLALIHPHLPPGLQSACVFRTASPAGGERSQLRHLVRVDGAFWHVRQWNPPPGANGEFTLDRMEWPVCHRVVGKYCRG